MQLVKPEPSEIKVYVRQCEVKKLLFFEMLYFKIDDHPSKKTKKYRIIFSRARSPEQRLNERDNQCTLANNHTGINLALPPPLAASHHD